MHRLITLFILLVGCAADEPPVGYSFCAEQHVSGDVIVCDKAFDDAPRVHLPPDDANVVYAAFGLVTRHGTRVVLVDDQGEINFNLDRDFARVPAAFEWPSYRFLERVYRITGTQVERDGKLEVHDAHVEVVLRIVPEVIDGQLFGTWEGTLSRRIAANQYDGDARVPIRVTFDRFADHHDIHNWEQTPDKPLLTYSLPVLGTIANATTNVTLADGSCAPALTSLGDANPRYDEADLATVELMREVAMHALGDTQLLFEGWMGDMAMATPAALIQIEPRDSFTQFGAWPHGTPNGQHLDDLKRVAAGGAACN